MINELLWAGLLAMLVVIGALATGMSFFDGFPWEALATVVAGAMAVLGAVSVAKRQMAISRGQNTILARQADILAKQVELEGLKLRSDLFDRRFEVFQAAHAYLFAAYNGENMIGHAASAAFKIARDRAQFLFDKQVSDALEELHNDGWKYGAFQKFIGAQAEQGRGDPEKDLEAVMDAQSAVGRHFSELFAIFGRHMTIGDVALMTSPAATQAPASDPESEA